jgi:hypothetical protein
MSEGLLPAAIAAAVRERSRVDGGGGAESAALQRFTVARTEALLRLREVPRGGPWEWTQGLLAASLAVSPVILAHAGASTAGEEQAVELTFTTPGAPLERVDLRGLALAGLDEAPTRLGELTVEEALARWRALVGAAVNMGLAQGPSLIEVITAGDARAYERREAAAGQDPYRERKSEARCAAGSWVVRVRSPRPSFGRRLASWLALSSDVLDQVGASWKRAQLQPNPEDDVRAGISLARALPGQRVRLGDHAVWGSLAAAGGPWLVRDGVKLLALDKTLREVGIDPAAFVGWIDCPRLRLTVDGAGVARDGAFELLVAWLHDARAHTFPGASGGSQVIWPVELEVVQTASGRPASITEISRRITEGRDLLYEWAHLREAVPASAQARVFLLWPSELAALKARFEGLRALPYRSVGEGTAFARVDLRPALEGSLPAVEVPLAEPELLLGAERLRLELRALVHKQPSSIAGSILLLAHDRGVAQSRDERRVIPGVTLLCTLVSEDPSGGVAIEALRGDRAALESIFERVRVAARAREDALWAAALAASSPWELPFVRAKVAESSALSVGVGLRIVGGELTLAWRDAPILRLPIGATLGGEPRSLGDALVMLREQGGVLCGDERQRWRSLEPADAEQRLWLLTAHGRDLCERVLGRAALWKMPVAVESLLGPRPAEAQRHLLLRGESVDGARALAAKDPRARAALVAHLLVARCLEAPTYGLEDAPLLRRYDPRALNPSRMVSLREVMSERPAPGLCLAETVSRELVGVVIEATLGEARLLHRALGLAPAISGGALLQEHVPGARTAVRRHGHDAPPLVSLPVVDPLAAGSLRIERAMEPAKIALWAGGLHIDDIALPAPLDLVGGRLWLTRQGVKVGSSALAARLRELAQELVRRALAERLLHPPESAEASASAALLSRLRGAPRALEWIADLLPVDEGPPGRALALGLSLQRQPLRRVVGVGQERLQQLLRQALGRAVALDAAMLSWKAARLRVGEGERAIWEVEIGRRSETIQRALARDASSAEVYVAAVLIAGATLAQAREQRLRGAEPEELVVALYRLLALAYAQG